MIIPMDNDMMSVPGMNLRGSEAVSKCKVGEAESNQG